MVSHTFDPPARATASPAIWARLGFIFSAASVLLLYSGLAYFRADGSSLAYPHLISNPLHPRYIYAAVFVAAAASLFMPVVRRRVPGPLLVTSGAFIVYLLASSTMAPELDLAEFATRVEFFVMLPAFMVVLAMARSARRILRLLRWVVLAESAFYVLLFFAPRLFPAFLFADRVGGFWINPNDAAFFVAGALPLIVLGASPPTRLAIYVVTLAGVTATLSRGGLIVWAAMFALSVFAPPGRPTAARRGEQLAIGLSIALTALLGSVASIFNGAVDGLSRFSDRAARLSSVNDTSATTRAYVVRAALAKFSDHPFFGYGAGYTANWGLGQSTHNIFALVLVEHGMLGAAAFAVWVLSLLSIPGVFGLYAFTYFVTMGLFSHNLLQGEHALHLALIWLASTLYAVPAQQPKAVKAQAAPSSRTEL